MDSMFEGWVSDHAVTVDLNGWDVSNVRSMESMFADSNVDWRIDEWNVLNLTNMRFMFEGTLAFNCALNQWTLSKATNAVISMFEMFRASLLHAGNVAAKPTKASSI